MKRTAGTLIYCLREGKVLLMHRNKAPNLGMWTGPGGKVEMDESPHECAVRELREETQLRAEMLTLRGLVTETSPRPDWQWQLFIYVVTGFSGALCADEREGTLRWWRMEAVLAGEAHMPEADVVFFPHVIDVRRPLYEARFVYDADLHVADIARF